MKVIFSCILIILSVGCKKEFFEDIQSNPDWLVNSCYNEGALTRDPSYRQVLLDEFEGPNHPSEKGNESCFTRAPNCSYRLDWGETTPCKQAEIESSSHLNLLNKCRWTIYSGWSIWHRNPALSSYDPKMVEVKNGSIFFYVEALSNKELPDSKIKCGINQHAHPDSHEHFDRNCPIRMGGVHSDGYRPGGHPGFVVGPGSRIEMRARFSTEKHGYAALWMWSTPSFNWDQGFIPKIERMNGFEIDIMESDTNSATPNIFQTIHSWFDEPNKTERGETIASNPHDQWAIYGAEWDENEVRFFMDNCYNVKIVDGAIGTDNKIVRINNIPSFLIMSMSSAIKKRSDLPPGTRLFMEVDWIKVYKK